MRIKYRGAELPHLGGKGSSEHRGARASSALLGAWMPEVFEIKKEANILSDYNMCSLQNPSPIAVLTSSLAVLSIGEIRIVANVTSTISQMLQFWNPSHVAQPTSVYSLSQAI